jgi:subtilisin-like proprotein convertase family protein
MKQSASILVLALSWCAFQIYGQTTQTQTVSLRQGWNLVSFRVLPENSTPASVLSGLSENPAVAITAMWSYDGGTANWQQWAPGSLLNADQTAIRSVVYHRGYWIHSALPNLTLRVTGRESPGGRIHFTHGWNLLGFPAAEAQSASLAQVDAIFRQHVQSTDPDVDLIYALSPNGSLLRWDFTIDRRMNDFNADGIVNSADEIFKQDYKLPDDIPGLIESAPNPDEFSALISGEGYWVHARRDFDLLPLLKTAVPADLDNVPQNNFPGPEDWDLDGDRALDVGGWSAPAPITATNQAGVFVPAGQKATQAILNNGGEGVLRWEATFLPEAKLAALSQNAVVLDPVSGETLTDTDTITLTVNRTGLSPGIYQGDLKIDSNGGARVFRVFIEVPELVGDFRGFATIDTVDGKKISLPAIDLGLSLFRSPDGTVRGQIRSDVSSHFPIPVSVQGELISQQRSAFVMVASYNLPKNAYLERTPGTLTFSLKEGDDSNASSHVGTVNPFLRPVFRELVLVGERTREDIALSGSFYDTLLGITAAPIKIQGTFELVRESLTPSAQPSAGASAPCSILGANQSLPEGAEKLFVLNNTLGCSPIVEPALIDAVRVYVHLEHTNKTQLRIRLLSPTENASDSNAGVLLYDGQQVGAPALQYSDLSWPVQFSDALQGLFPQEGPTALTDAYRGQRADQGNGQWRLGITDLVPDNSGGRLTKWLVSFVGPMVYRLSGRVVDSASNALAGVELTLTGPEVLHCAVSGTDGTFTFENLPPYRYRLAAYKAGYRVVAPERLMVDLVNNMNLPEAITLESLPPAGLLPDLWITPAWGRIAQGGEPFVCTLGYVARTLIPGCTYQFILQRYAKDPTEPNPGEAGYASSLRPPVPVGNPILVPAAPGLERVVTAQLSEPGVYSVDAVVYLNSLQVRRVGEASPKALQRYIIRVETLPAGVTGGRQVLLADGAFSSGGVVPFEFYPPTTLPSQNLNDPPAAFVPVGAGNFPIHDFSYRVLKDGPPQYSIRLGEDMVRSVSVDWNGPDVRASWDGPPWDPGGDPWLVNDAERNGRDLDVAEDPFANAIMDFGRGPIRDVGWVAYNLLPGDALQKPCPGALPEEPQRCFVLTSSLGSAISGRSTGPGLALEGGTRLTWPRVKQP